MTGHSSSVPPTVSAAAEPRQALEPLVSRREILAVVLWTVFADLLIFRSFGYAGPAVFFMLVPVLFWIQRPLLVESWVGRITVGLLLVVATRLVWSGSLITVLSATALVIAVSMCAAGVFPLVLEGFAWMGRSFGIGFRRLGQYRLPQQLRKSARSRNRLIAFVLPAVAAIVFGSIFVLANPDLFDWVTTRFSRVTTAITEWLADISIWELPFCALALLVGAGLMRPGLTSRAIGDASTKATIAAEQSESPWYYAYRNTLWTLIVLFGVYLVFEFATLWGQKFPEGFYYAGYAHQGAAWLTFALALATGTLSLVFRSSMLRDPRIDSIRRLAWIWSASNLLLAIAVYNRLMIYVGYNGMTRMRTIGFFGITVVVIGFTLVVFKIAKNQSFWWLIRAQLIALTLTIIAYSCFPVDYIAHRYNAASVASGYLKPAVMIAVKPIEDEGVFALLDIANCEDKTIREGVLAILAQRQSQLDGDKTAHWTENQLATTLLRRKLKANESLFVEYQNAPKEQEQAIAAFREYAMQWY